jgi:hypothetical protein
MRKVLVVVKKQIERMLGREFKVFRERYNKELHDIHCVSDHLASNGLDINLERVEDDVFFLDLAQGGVVLDCRFIVEVSVFILVDAFEVDEYFLERRRLKVEDFAFFYIIECELVKLEHIDD